MTASANCYRSRTRRTRRESIRMVVFRLCFLRDARVRRARAGLSDSARWMQAMKPNRIQFVPQVEIERAERRRIERIAELIDEGYAPTRGWLIEPDVQALLEGKERE